ncbi:MAG: family 78 glycoside hydrolase catalytic domain [Alistipes sp.]|nr:family 78 glycoside hydrolase catalytic domain [Alistipes sp.]
MKKSFILLFAAVLSILPSVAASRAEVVNLTCEHLVCPLAIDSATPHFSWQIASSQRNDYQRSYRIQVATDSLKLAAGVADLWDSGVVESAESVLIPYQGEKLASLKQCWWRVTVNVASRRDVIVSQIARFGIGLIDDSAIEGEFIGMENSGATAAMLRQRFDVEKLGTQVHLHVNSLGYHEIWINGSKVGDACLAPAISQLNKRSLWVAYDVKPYLNEGKNDIVIWLGQGWYKRHTFGRWQPEDPYTEPLVRAQVVNYVEGEPKICCKTDSSWRAALSGYRDTGSWNALDFGGEELDARRNPRSMQAAELDKLSWQLVVVREKENHKATPQMVEPDYIAERLSAKTIVRRENGDWQLDFGKVITGWFELRMRGLDADDRVVIEYSDEVDGDGNLLEQKQLDTYIARGEEDKFCNKFNHHAFRYVRISGLKDTPIAEDAHALMIHTRYSDDVEFVCSDEDLNAIHDMIEHTMRCLAYNGYMVDCPHLERAGYGGDGNSSTQILQTMCGTAPLFRNWIQSWADAMREGGSLPHVAPNAGAGGGGPYWCGFMVMAPWHTYLNYRDLTVVERYYAHMKEWLGYAEKHFKDGLKERWPDTPYRDWYLGDWLAPWGVDAGNGESVQLVNNCFISDCYAKMTDMALLLNRQEDAEVFKARREALNRAIHERFYNEATCSYATGSQLDMVYPMLVGATPADVRQEVRNRLMEYSREVMKNHIGGGLVGVPLITRWAVEAKGPDFMYQMLKQRDYPGYLHMIDNGATATWEYWSGERSRVHNCYNGIGVWFYQALGGLTPEYLSREDKVVPGAGYRRVIIEPQIPHGVEWCKLSKRTPYGEIQLAWRLADDDLCMDVVLPVGVSATVPVPDNTKRVRYNGKKVDYCREITIGSGRHTIVCEM